MNDYKLDNMRTVVGKNIKDVRGKKMSKNKAQAEETSVKILQQTYDELVLTSGLPKAEIAGQMLGLGVGMLAKQYGLLLTIKQIIRIQNMLIDAAITGA